GHEIWPMHPQWTPVRFYEPVRKLVHDWPTAVRKELGAVLTRLQKRESIGMPDVRPMPEVAVRRRGDSRQRTTGNVSYVSCHPRPFWNSRLPCLREEIREDAGAREEGGASQTARVPGRARGGSMSDKGKMRTKGKSAVAARSPDEIGKVLGLSEG